MWWGQELGTFPAQSLEFCYTLFRQGCPRAQLSSTRTQSPPPTSAPSTKRHDLATWYNHSTSSLSPSSILSLSINIHNRLPPVKYRHCDHRAVAVFRHAGIFLGSNVHLNCLLTSCVVQKGKGETFAVNCSHLLSVNSKTPQALQNYSQVYPTSWCCNTTLSTFILESQNF